MINICRRPVQNECFFFTEVATELTHIQHKFVVVSTFSILKLSTLISMTNELCAVGEFWVKKYDSEL